MNSVAGALAVWVGLSGCGKSGSNVVQDAPAVPVVVAAAEAREVPVLIREVGTVESTGAVTIQSRVDGQIVKVFVADGEEVKADQPLIQIDPAPLEIQLRIARATLARDEATLANAIAKQQRGDALLAQKFISIDAYKQLKTDREFAQATVDADHAAVDNAALQLSYATVRAPVAGKIGHVSQQVGNMIRAVAQTPLVTLNVLDSVDVAFSIPQQQLDLVRAAMHGGAPAVRATAPGASDGDADPAAATGTLTFIDNAADPLTGTIKLRARFDNRARTLWPGAYVNVTMSLPVDGRAIVVPSVAIGQGPNGAYVYVVSESIAEQRAVQVGRTSQDVTIVISGVQPGELVVVDGQSRLSPNARVAIFPAGRPA
ncbi:MAG TPA: efflux RND transporter periplasmic adaptor subunit [Pseudomonadales bacterium]|nr:efflux RND transporter periplasmic adaptor subunit [Pseudomonadales bacterium]